MGARRHTHAERRHALGSQGETRVEHHHRGGREREPTRRLGHRDRDDHTLRPAPLGGLEHIRLRVAGEERAAPLDLRVAFRSERRDRGQRGRELGLRPRVAGDADLGHPLRVVLAVTGDRQEGDNGQPGGERLVRGQTAGVLHHRVARGHELGHLVGPADHGAEPARFERGLQANVPAAHRDRVVLPRPCDRLDRADDVTDAPRTRDDQNRALVVRESERTPTRGAHRG